MARRAGPGAILVAAWLLACLPALRAAQSPAGGLPTQLSDEEFWRLSADLSEPGGTFSSDNLVSNERDLPNFAAALRSRVAPGGAYLGVGPEQNFTYIAAVRPRIAFVIDIRRANLHLHLLYKALFELSADRADFVSRLLIKKRPGGFTRTITAKQLMESFWDVFTGDETTFRASLADVFDVLTRRHGFPLSDDDRAGIERIYHAFYWNGPRITWQARVSPPDRPPDPLQPVPFGLPSWADLMMLTDPSGVEQSFLATEDDYLFVKDLQARNLVVPVVGDFAGPKAVRAVGEYVRQRGVTVRTFYASNVEDILQNNGKRTIFCASAGTLPLDPHSVIVRWGRLLPVSGPFQGGLTIHYGPSGGGDRSIVVNGRALPADQVRAYFAQPDSAVLDLPAVLKSCGSG